MDATWEKSLREERNRHQRENPSFSSTLLDAIYRSIDESNGKGEEEELILYRETMKKKHGNGSKQEEMASLQRACMIEKWMEKKVSYEKVAVRRKSTADFDKKGRKDFDSLLLNSSSSSSDSSSGGSGGFSSSESESIYAQSSSRSTTNHTMQRPKPIRTSISAWPERYQRPVDHEIDHSYHHHQHHERSYAPAQKQPKHEGGSSFVKTKSKALKIYGDLKKVKQPISPGGRLASFLNSLFTTGNAKKAKLSSSSHGFEERQLKSEQASSTCSSASSFSRSCLSKTPSSRGKLSNNNGAKRSVRFCPVSVIVDEDCRPCGHKSLYGSEENTTTTLMSITATRSSPTNDQELKFHVMNENRRVEEVARDLLKNYQKKNKKEDFHMRDACNNIGNEQAVESSEEDEECDDDDDLASCASSDLFELDNLSSIGIERYREELPVYETTYLDTNRAIANGLIL